MEKFKLAKLHDFGGDLSKRWCVDFYYLHPETNKFQKFRQWLSARLLTRQARYLKGKELCAQLNAKLRTGFNPFQAGNDGKNISAALLEVIELKKRSTGQQRYVDLRTVYWSFRDWLNKNSLASLRPEELSQATANAYLDALLARGVCNRTYNNYLNDLRTMFNVLIQREYCEVNVWKKIPPLPAREADINFVTAAERREIKARLQQDHPPLYAVSLLVYHCFMRPIEICRLRICDINFEERHINVRASQVKNGRNRQLVMSAELVEALRALNLDVWPQEYFCFAYGSSLTPSPLQVRSTEISDTWRALVKQKYGIQKNIYDLKATGAGRAFEAGINARDIQNQLGHYSLEVTQVYLNKVSRVASRAFNEKMPAF